MTQPASMPQERIASRCVCCDSVRLQASPAVLMPFIADRVFGWKPVRIDASWGLKTIPEGMAYTVCNTLYCEDCGLVFLDIRFSDAELARLYHDYRGASYTRLREHYEPNYTVRNDALNQSIDYLPGIEAWLLAHMPSPCRVLDWGGDDGHNTPFRGQAELVHVFEISDKPMLDGVTRVERHAFHGEGYDLIVCSNVLEHVPYPEHILRDIAQVMRPGTRLYLEVPFESLMQQDLASPHLHKRHWHEHINFFSQTSLVKLLTHCGFTVQALQTGRQTVAMQSANIFQLICTLA